MAHSERTPGRRLAASFTRGIAVALLLASAAAIPTRQTVAASEPTLVVANWKAYGSDTPYAIKGFEAICHCKVVHQYFDSEQGLINLLRTGGVGHIDVALPNLAYVQPAIQQGLIQPISVSRLSSYNSLYPALRALPDDKSGGAVYGVPWMWGTTSLWYNPQIVKGSPNSWAALWDSTYKGKMSFYDDPTTAIMTAALYLHENPYHPDLSKVQAALIRQKQLDVSLWTSWDDWQKLYNSKQIVIGNVWSGPAGSAAAAGHPIRYVIPKEGAVGWVDNWTIVKNAPHPDLAYQWINYMISTAFQVRYANDLADEPPDPSNSQVLGKISSHVATTIMLHPEWLKSLVLQRAIPQATLRAWTQTWEIVKAS
ncbi:MAG TPA: extracellular solute-binding protein [Chloroflexota bacterium]|nr:extracellular solute-binding protein [Chloroflexota bacterium]